MRGPVTYGCALIMASCLHGCGFILTDVDRYDGPGKPALAEDKR